MSIRNPILHGYNPDPSIVHVGRDYFLVTSTFEYFPGIPIYNSKDLITWSLIGHALTRRSQLDLRTVEPSAGIWAPTIRYHNGKFYIAAGCFNCYRPSEGLRVYPLGFYVSTTNIWDSSSWSDPIFFDVYGFDQDLFWDDDGKVYLTYTHALVRRDPHSTKRDFAIHVSEVDMATGKSKKNPVVVRESPTGISEGPHVFKRNGYYYLLAAEGGTDGGHSELVFRSSSSVYGPYEHCPQGAIVRSSNSGGVHNTGHLDFVEDNAGKWWSVLLGYRHRVGDDNQTELSSLGRETFLVSVDWKDDWPIVNNGKDIVTIEPEVDELIAESFWEDKFESDGLSLGWYSKGTPLRSDYTLLERPGFLRIYGNPYDLSSPEHPAALFRKQENFNVTFESQLEFDPALSETYQAGIVVWYSAFSHASLGIARSSNDLSKRAIVFTKKTIGEEVIKRDVCEIDSGPVTLLIVASRSMYRLFFRLGFSNEDGIILGGDISSAALLRYPPIGGLFTGVQFGLYSTGQGEPCLAPADFAYACCCAGNDLVLKSD
ncbi:glycoside hydrolase family 43 protein [Lipomyces doorenjongii]|uniref:glycoside hydrolase family 43 protein n=1 Tax=Lipomyces doorenjongii TaxID=383834 RepID=UPI0034CD4C10